MANGRHIENRFSADDNEKFGSDMKNHMQI